MRPVLLLLAMTAVLANAQAPLSVAQSRGKVLRGYRQAFALTQVQLGAAAALSATRISRIERGLDTATVLEEDRIILVFDSLFRAQYEPGTERWLVNAIIRARRSRP